MRFVEIARSEPTADLGPELALFDRTGMLVASYRTKLNAVDVWIYMSDCAVIDQYLILDTEDRARELCEHVTERRNGPPPHTTPPNLDEMMKGLSI